MRKRTSIVLALLIAGSAAPAHADTIDVERARALSNQGREHHDKGDYDRAVIFYLAAYEITPVPGLLFNLGQSYRLKGDCTNAAIMYRRYLQSNPDRHLELARTQLRTVESCVSPTTVTPAIAVPSPLPTTGTAIKLDAMRTSGAAFRRGGVAVAIAGGVMIGAGAMFAVRGARAEAELERRHADGASWRDVQGIESSGRTSNTRAAVFTVGGGLATITGGVLYLVGRHARGERRTTITVGPSSAGGQVRLKWTF